MTTYRRNTRKKKVSVRCKYSWNGKTTNAKTKQKKKLRKSNRVRNTFKRKKKQSSSRKNTPKHYVGGKDSNIDKNLNFLHDTEKYRCIRFWVVEDDEKDGEKDEDGNKKRIIFSDKNTNDVLERLSLKYYLFYKFDNNLCYVFYFNSTNTEKNNLQLKIQINNSGTNTFVPCITETNPFELSPELFQTKIQETSTQINFTVAGDKVTFQLTTGDSEQIAETTVDYKYEENSETDTPINLTHNTNSQARKASISAAISTTSNSLTEDEINFFKKFHTRGVAENNCVFMTFDISLVHDIYIPSLFLSEHTFKYIQQFSQGVLDFLEKKTTIAHGTEKNVASSLLRMLVYYQTLERFWMQLLAMKSNLQKANIAYEVYSDFADLIPIINVFAVGIPSVVNKYGKRFLKRHQDRTEQTKIDAKFKYDEADSRMYRTICTKNTNGQSIYEYSQNLAQNLNAYLSQQLEQPEDNFITVEYWCTLVHETMVNVQVCPQIFAVCTINEDNQNLIKLQKSDTNKYIIILNIHNDILNSGIQKQMVSLPKSTYKAAIKKIASDPKLKQIIVEGAILHPDCVNLYDIQPVLDKINEDTTQADTTQADTKQFPLINYTNFILSHDATTGRLSQLERRVHALEQTKT